MAGTAELDRLADHEPNGPNPAPRVSFPPDLSLGTPWSPSEP